MSNREVAGVMLISVNTVKTHLKAIYRKLDAPVVARRSGAPASWLSCRELGSRPRERRGGRRITQGG